MVLSLLLSAVLPLGRAEGSPAHEVYVAALVRRDPEKLLRAIEMNPRAKYLALLFDLGELTRQTALDLVVGSRSRRHLDLWRMVDSGNALPDLLEVWDDLVRKRRFPELDRLEAIVSAHERVRYHYREMELDALRFLLQRNGNTVTTWRLWFGSGQHGNLVRMSELLVLLAYTSNYYTLLEKPEVASRYLKVVGQILDLHRGAEHRAVRALVLAVRKRLIYERILAGLPSGDAGQLGDLVREHGAAAVEESEAVGALRFLSHVGSSFAGAERYPPWEEGPPQWDDLLGVSEVAMARFAEALERMPGDEAARSIWHFPAGPVEDDAKEVEGHLDLFTRENVSRADATRFMEALRQKVKQRASLPPWCFFAFKRVLEQFRAPEALGRFPLEPAEERYYRVVCGSFRFALGDRSSEQDWIQAFRQGRTSSMVTIGFARNGTRRAVPVIIERYRREVAERGLLATVDYYFALRDLTGKDLGLDPDAWWRDRLGQ